MAPPQGGSGGTCRSCGAGRLRFEFELEFVEHGRWYLQRHRLGIDGIGKRIRFGIDGIGKRIQLHPGGIDRAAK